MRILGLSGSLGKASVSTRLLKAAAQVAPGNVTIVPYDGLGSLPHFNPDLDREPPPPGVAEFRSELNCSAGVVISIMEYANGVPGVLKNALDWVAGSAEFYGKPVALFYPPSASFAQVSLLETLAGMTARLIPEAFLLVPNHQMSPREVYTGLEYDLLTRMQAALAAFAKVIGTSFAELPS
jgi:chromate reductase